MKGRIEYRWDIEKHDHRECEEHEDGWESCNLFRDGGTPFKNQAEDLLNQVRIQSEPEMEYRLVRYTFRSTKEIEAA